MQSQHNARCSGGEGGGGVTWTAHNQRHTADTQRSEKNRKINKPKRGTNGFPYSDVFYAETGEEGSDCITATHTAAPPSTLQHTAVTHMLQETHNPTTHTQPSQHTQPATHTQGAAAGIRRTQRAPTHCHRLSSTHPLPTPAPPPATQSKHLKRSHTRPVTTQPSGDTHTSPPPGYTTPHRPATTQPHTDPQLHNTTQTRNYTTRHPQPTLTATPHNTQPPPQTTQLHRRDSGRAQGPPSLSLSL